ncbi:hypothetical protein [Phaeobacter porticola]|uniref:Uncharacterized protein n=1 Tax=Phaeobacter porticola TaxID=1844006 RepID=A0A1L3I4M7_9RHOB|nr:hypothetical protein [Phaeobacter porticola]APG47036.1 hypothetical protein PhaeoP97_01618 [Phaeobacter porticola]
MRVLQSKFPASQFIMQRLLKRRALVDPGQYADDPHVFLRSEGASKETAALQAMALRSFGSAPDKIARL